MARKPATPKPPKAPALDPLRQARVAATGFPALSPQIGHNRQDHDPDGQADKLVSALLRVRQIDAQIAELNSSKADVFRMLRRQGYDTGALRTVIRDLRMDPLRLEARREALETYWAAVNGRLPAGADPVPEQAEAAE